MKKGFNKYRTQNTKERYNLDVWWIVNKSKNKPMNASCISCVQQRLWVAVVEEARLRQDISWFFRSPSRPMAFKRGWLTRKKEPAVCGCGPLHDAASSKMEAYLTWIFKTSYVCIQNKFSKDKLPIF